NHPSPCCRSSSSSSQRPPAGSPPPSCHSPPRKTPGPAPSAPEQKAYASCARSPPLTLPLRRSPGAAVFFHHQVRDSEKNTTECERCRSGTVLECVDKGVCGPWRRSELPHLPAKANRRLGIDPRLVNWKPPWRQPGPGAETFVRNGVARPIAAVLNARV